MGDRKSVRMFLAIELPEGIKALIEGIKEGLRPAVQGIRWTRPEAMHLTLKFFGDLFPDDVIRISEVVGRNVRDIDPMQLTVESPGVFPGMKSPRVLWLGVGGDIGRLAALQSVIERDLEACGFHGEKRSFTPHLTLGRARSRDGIRFTAEGVIDGIEGLSAHRFDVRELILFASELKPGGAVYRKLARFPFGGQGRVSDG